jgi:hypothetical protein
VKELSLSSNDKNGLNNFIDYCKNWSEEHQAEVGVTEMAIGAGLLSWGVMNGHIIVGQDILGSMLPDIGAMAGAATGGIGSSAIAAMFLKSIFIGGVTGVAGVTSIPAIALIGGATLIFSSFGYVIGDVIERVIDPDFMQLLSGGSILAIGVALMIDGASRIVKDVRVLQASSTFKNGVIHFAESSTGIVAKSFDELQSKARELNDEIDRKIKELANHPDAEDVAFKASAVSTIAGGSLLGGALAGGTVTVLGSHGLGAIALSLGLVSAPVWPIVAGGAAGLAVTLAAWRGVQSYRNKQCDVSPEKLIE